MNNFQLNTITGYNTITGCYKIPVTLYQEAGADLIYIYIYIYIFGFKLLGHIVSNLKY